MVSWEWTEVFWTYWVFFSIVIGLSLTLLLLFCNKTLQYCLRPSNSNELFGVLWLIIIVNSITMNSCIIILGIIDYF